ncbi:MAG: WbqC family protein [Bacteroidales bacterium]|nr:WbqC family protein [Bacteroidales bacterium]
MITPLTLHPDTTILLEPRYFGSIGWYAAMASCEYALVDYTSRYDKRRKLTHRTTIADVNGPLDLTVPISRPPLTDHDAGPLTWSDILVSPHDQWWNIHRVTLESAYGRTPYFEFYIDRFLPALTPGVVDRFPTLRELDTFLDREIRRILCLPGSQIVSRPKGDIVDMRRREPEPRAAAEWPPYYQVRAARHGFIPGLSILDLIFNLGPEAPLYLRKVLATD